MSTEEICKRLQRIEDMLQNNPQQSNTQSLPAVEEKKSKRKIKTGNGEKRPPSKYNNFVREMIAKLRQEEQDRGDGDKMGHKEIFKVAAEAWTRQKEANNN